MTLIPVKYNSHYEYLDANLGRFLDELHELSEPRKGCVKGSIVGDGDKCYGYRQEWEDAGVPFNRGVAIYLLSKYTPYAQQCRETENGWVDVSDWVISMYPTFKRVFDRIEL